MQDNIQIEMGADEKDFWLVFNKATPHVQMTHAEARNLIKDIEFALAEAEAAALAAAFVKGADR